MFKLPIRTWVRNAAAIFSAQHGAVAQQAREAGCSRETVYRVRTQRAIEVRLALDLLREQQARSRAETTKTLHEKRAA